MSATIDKRVVEMQFDNKQFEAATKETINSLGKLKESLNLEEAVKGLNSLDKAASNVHLSAIASSVEALQKRFSVLGEVGHNAVMKVVNLMTGKLTAAFKFVDNAIVSGGKRRAMNIENAHFQLQALLKDESRVQAVMDDAMKSVDGTAYAFDEAAKAASQFAASGIQAGDQMLNALRGVVGVSAMTNSQFEDISRIFTAVAGQGRLMGDQLLQLSGRGLNAASTIATYVNQVTSGAKQIGEGVSAETAAAIKALTNGARVGEGEIRKFVSEGKISFKIFSEAMTDAFADSAEKANETFTGAFSNMKAALARIGAGFFSPLVAQNNEIVGLFNSLRIRINEVKKALVFDSELGNVKALSKQVTDWILSMAKAASEWVDKVNLSKPLELFYYWLEIGKNVLKGFWSVLKPVGVGLKNFLSFFKIQSVIDFSKAVHELSKSFILADDKAKDLSEAFRGIGYFAASVLNLLGKFVNALFRINAPSGTLTDILLGMAGALGKAAFEAGHFINNSQPLQMAFKVIGAVIGTAVYAIKEFVTAVISFLSQINALDAIKLVLTGIVGLFVQLGTTAAPYLKALIEYVKNFNMETLKMLPEKVLSAISKFTGFLASLLGLVKGISFKKPSKEVQDYSQYVGDATIKMNSMGVSIGGLITMLKKLIKGEYFDFKGPTKKIDDFMAKVEKFAGWVPDALKRAFGDATVQDLISGAAGIGIIYAFSKAAKSVTGLSAAFGELSKSLAMIAQGLGVVAKSITSIPKAMKQIFDGFQSTLKAYQRDLNASALLKTAAAIAVLAGALALLSLCDVDKLRSVAVSLAGVAAVFFIGVTKLKKVALEGVTVNQALEKFINSVDKALMEFAKAQKWKAIGKAVKNFAESVAIIAASIIGIALMYKHDAENLNEGVKLIKNIMYTLAGLTAAMGIISEMVSEGMKSFQKGASGLVAIAAALMIVVVALNKLFKMEFPEDWETKVEVLIRLLVDVGLLAIALSLAGKLSNGKSTGAASIVAAAVALQLVVGALKKLFDMDLPADFQTKTELLRSLMLELGFVMIAFGAAAKLAGGKIKAVGTILAVCFYIGVIVTALIVLTLVPLDKMIRGAVSLGICLFGLGLALLGAGKVASPEATKAVYAMALTVGAIVAALAVLGMMPIETMVRSGAALGIMLFALAGDLYAASKVANGNSLLAILELAGVSALIAYELYKLSTQPWEGMLAGAVAMGVTLLAFGASLAIIGNIKAKAINFGLFLEGLVALGAVALALYFLAEQPWQNMTAAAISLSGTMIALGVAFAIITNLGPLVPAAAASLLSFDLFLANLIGVLGILGVLGETFRNTMGAGGETLKVIGDALGGFVGSIIKGFSDQASAALPILAANLSLFADNLQGFIEGMKNINGEALQGVKYLASMVIEITKAQFLQGITRFVTGGQSLVQFGMSLVEFAPLIATFALIVKDIDPTAVFGVAMITQIMSGLEAALPKVYGLQSIFTGTQSLAKFGENLLVFAPFMRAFAWIVKDIDPSSVMGVAMITKIMSELEKSLPKISLFERLFSGAQSLDGFGLKLFSFGSYMKAYADRVSGIDAMQMGMVTDELHKLIEVTRLIKDMDVSSVSAFAQALTALAANALNEFMKAFQNGSQIVLTMINSEIDIWIAAIEAQQVRFETSGALAINTFCNSVERTMDARMVNLTTRMDQSAGYMVAGFNQGIAKNTGRAMTAMGLFAKAIDDVFRDFFGIHSPGELNEEEAGYMVDGDIQGIEENTDRACDAHEEFAENIDEAFTSKYNGDVAADNATNYVKGVVAGTEAGKQPVGTSASELGSTAVNNFANNCNATNGYNSISGFLNGILQSFKDNWNNIAGYVGKYAQGIAQTFKQNLGFDTGLSIPANLSSGVQAGVKEYSPIAQENMADMITGITNQPAHWWDAYNVYGGEDSLEKQTEDLLDFIKESQGDIVDQMNAGTAAKKGAGGSAKATNKELVKDEKDYWYELLQTKKAGLDAEKYQDMTAAEFRKEVLEETKNILSEYTSQLESTRDSIMSQMDLFAEVEEQEAKSKYELISNLKDQINAYEDYVQVLGTLNTRLEGTELGEYIKTMGVDSLAQLEEINSMTDTELNRYAMLYDEKLALAGEAAQIQLSNLKTESEAKLAELFGGMASSVELFDFASVFDGSIESITKYVQDVMLPLDQATRDAEAAANAIGIAIDKGLVDGLSLDDTSEVADQLTKVIDHIKEVNEIPATDAGKAVGENLTEGVADGLTEDTSSISDKTKELMDLIEKYLQEEGEIHSPSARSNREVGQPITQGVGEGMLEAIQACTDAATDIMLAIVEAFKAKQTDVTNSINEMMEFVKSGIQNEDVNLTDLGNKSILSFVLGIRNTYPDVRDSVNEMLDEIKGIFEKRQNEFDTAAVTAITLYLTAVRSKYEEARTTAHTFVNEILNSMKSHDWEFETAGAHAGQGFINGIKSKLREAAIAGAELARAAKNALESELDIESPSKEMLKDGDFTTIGFVNGIYKNIHLAAKAGKALGEEVNDAASESMDDLMAVYDGFDLTGDPVIKPLVDMENIYDARRQIEKLFNEAIDVASLSAFSAHTGFERGRQVKMETSENQTGTTEKEAANFSFVQNNYSPKALSRVDIYRQTKNQFSTLKGLVDKA